MKVLVASFVLLLGVFCLTAPIVALDSHSSFGAAHHDVYESIPAKIICPHGFTVFNYNECVKTKVETTTADELLSCPPGFLLNGNNKCTQENINHVEVPPQSFPTPPVACPPGYSFDGKDCFMMEPTCPPGYYYNTMDKQCWSTTQTRIETPRPAPLTMVASPCPMVAPCQTTNVSPMPMAGPCPMVVAAPCQTTHVSPMPMTGPCPMVVAAPCQTTHVPPMPIQTTPCQASSCAPHNSAPAFNQIATSIPPNIQRTTIPLPPTAAPVAWCQPGYNLEHDKCVFIVSKPIEMEAIRRCPVGYMQDVNGLCIRRISTPITVEATIECPPGYTMVGRLCQRVTRSGGDWVTGHHSGNPQTVTNITVPETSANHHVTVTNSISVPVNIHNVNNHTTYVNGRVEPSTPYVPEKQVTVEEPHEVEEEEKPGKKCCEVVSPRICRRKTNKQWGCFHRRTEQCGQQCTSSRIYLRPPQPVYRPRIMVMAPPPPPPPQVVYQPAVPHAVYQQPPPPPRPQPAPYPYDCSMCSYGHCPNYCNSYDCEATNSCAYVNQQSYCSEYGGRPCTQDFGCMEGDYCA